MIGPASYSSSFRATLVFGILGGEAQPAIPGLTQIAMTSKDQLQFDAAIQSLAYIGTDSLPSFNNILTKGPPDAQFSALGWLAVFDTNVVAVLPAAIKCLVGTNDEVGNEAADVLGRLDMPQSVLFPSLTNALTSSPIFGRVRIIRCFFGMDSKAQYAVPILHSIALTDPSIDVRDEASNALSHIDPKDFKKASSW